MSDRKKGDLRSLDRRQTGERGSSSPSAALSQDQLRMARAEMAASAGLSEGRISLEALYLIPTEFTEAYQRLFHAALKEADGQGEQNPKTKIKAKKGATTSRRVWKKWTAEEMAEMDRKALLAGLSPREWETENEMKAVNGRWVNEEVELALDRDPALGGGSARAGGRRHRLFWTVRDEQAFRLKRVVDRELDTLAQDLLDRLGRKARVSEREKRGEAEGKRSGARVGEDHASQRDQCPRSSCRRFINRAWRFCPWCGMRSEVVEKLGEE